MERISDWQRFRNVTLVELEVYEAWLGHLLSTRRAHCSGLRFWRHRSRFRGLRTDRFLGLHRLVLDIGGLQLDHRSSTASSLGRTPIR